jgi:hypothetical protein
MRPTSAGVTNRPARRGVETEVILTVDSDDLLLR